MNKPHYFADAFPALIEKLATPEPWHDSGYMLEHFQSKNPSYKTIALALDKIDLAKNESPSKIVDWITLKVRHAIERLARTVLEEEGASAVFIGSQLKCVDVAEDTYKLHLQIDVPVRGVGKKPLTLPEVVEAAEAAAGAAVIVSKGKKEIEDAVENKNYPTAAKLGLKLGKAKVVKPIQTLQRWVGKHKSATLWHDPQPGDYGYFENVRQEMFFDGISWIPVSDFLDMHNKGQAKQAFEIEAKETKKTVQSTFLYMGTVDNLDELEAIKGAQPGQCRTCLDNGTMYVWNGVSWLPLDSAEATHVPGIMVEPAQPPEPKPAPKMYAEIFPRKRVIKRKKSE